MAKNYFDFKYIPPPSTHDPTVPEMIHAIEEFEAQVKYAGAINFYKGLSGITEDTFEMHLENPSGNHKLLFTGKTARDMQNRHFADKQVVTMLAQQKVGVGIVMPQEELVLAKKE